MDLATDRSKAISNLGIFNMHYWGSVSVRIGVSSILLVGCSISIPPGNSQRSVSVEKKVMQIPDEASNIPECTQTFFNVADCINQLSVLKRAVAAEDWTIKISEGAYVLTEAIVLYNVENLAIEGASLADPSATTLAVTNLLASRASLQYFTFLVGHSKNLAVRGLKLTGGNLSGQRAVGVCALPTDEVSDLMLDSLILMDYDYFNVIAGNSIPNDGMPAIVTQHANKNLGVTKQALVDFANHIASFAPEDAYCGGAVRNLTLARSKIYMRSVGFYFVPPTQNMTKAAIVNVPDPLGGTLPSWYADAKAVAAKFTGIVVMGNSFINALPNDPDQTKVDALIKKNQYHSAMKIGGSVGLIVKNNVIDAADLPLAFRDGAAINLSSDAYDTVLDSNTIRLSSAATTPAGGVAIQLYFQDHSVFGYGTPKVFGAISGTEVKNNQFYNAPIRVADCCVKAAPTPSVPNPFDGRPYCLERDSLAKKGLFFDRISIHSNYRNGNLNEDSDLILLASSNTSWVNSYKALEAAGTGGISCRDSMDIQFAP